MELFRTYICITTRNAPYVHTRLDSILELCRISRLALYFVPGNPESIGLSRIKDVNAQSYFINYIDKLLS